MFYRKSIVLFAICFVAITLLSCSTTRLTNTWRDPSYTSGPMTNMIVIAVKKNPLHRRFWEDGFAAEFAKHGVTVTPSYRVWPNDLPDTADVVAEVRKNNYDGVLIISRMATEYSTTDVPGYATKTPVVGYDQWRNEYYTTYEREYHPASVDSTKIIRNLIDVWTTKKPGHMIWSGTGETIDPNSGKEVHGEIVDLITPELVDQGIIGPEKK